MKYGHLYSLVFMCSFCLYCKGQTKTDSQTGNIKSETKDIITSYGPNTMVRNIKRDRKGDMLIAASRGGVFRYDGKSFINLTSKVGSPRFWNVLEDRSGDLWFSSTDSGVYYYHGKSFQHFTTREGLANNQVICIYEDRIGNIWFGTGRGVSRYDGKSFLNFTARQGLSNDDVTTIIEDKTGKFWFGTRGVACVYDGKKFAILTHNDSTFSNVWSIIEDKKGNIWLGGSDGLWRYDGSTFTNITRDFLGYIYEDKKGNIWTSSETANGWLLSRYDEKSLSNKKPTVIEIRPEDEVARRMIFGISEAIDGSIWFGSLDGLRRYDGNTVTDFKDKAVHK